MTRRAFLLHGGTTVDHQEEVGDADEAARRETRVMLGTMIGFLVGVAASWSCCGMLALSMFFGLVLPDIADLPRLAAGITCVAFFTWTGRTLMKNVGKQSPSPPGSQSQS